MKSIRVYHKDRPHEGTLLIPEADPSGRLKNGWVVENEAPKVGGRNSR